MVKKPCLDSYAWSLLTPSQSPATTKMANSASASKVSPPPPTPTLQTNSHLTTLNRHHHGPRSRNPSPLRRQALPRLRARHHGAHVPQANRRHAADGEREAVAEQLSSGGGGESQGFLRGRGWRKDDEVG